MAMSKDKYLQQYAVSTRMCFIMALFVAAMSFDRQDQLWRWRLVAASLFASAVFFGSFVVRYRELEGWEVPKVFRLLVPVAQWVMVGVLLAVVVGMIASSG